MSECKTHVRWSVLRQPLKNLDTDPISFAISFDTSFSSTNRKVEVRPSTDIKVMSSWSRPVPPHLDPSRNHEVNKSVRPSSSRPHERATDRWASNNAASTSDSRTSTNGQGSQLPGPMYSLPSRPTQASRNQLLPRPPASPPPPPPRYLPAGSLDPRNSTPVSVSINRLSSQAGDRSRTNGSTTQHRQDTRKSLVDDRDDHDRRLPPPPASRPPPLPLRARSPPKTEPTSTLGAKRSRKQSQYIPSFIPSLDEVEPGQLPPSPVASTSASAHPAPGALITELAEIDLARTNALAYDRYPVPVHPPTSSYDRYHQPGPLNGSSSSTGRYDDNSLHASPPWPQAQINRHSPLYGAVGLPKRPDVGPSRARSPSTDSRARRERNRDHWSPQSPRRRERYSMDRSSEREQERDFHARPPSPQSRYGRSPSRGRGYDDRRRDGSSVSYRGGREYRDESVDSRGYPYRSRSISRSRSRDVLARDERDYDQDRDWDRRNVDDGRGRGDSWVDRNDDRNADAIREKGDSWVDRDSHPSRGRGDSWVNRNGADRRYSTGSEGWSDVDGRERGRIRDRDRPTKRQTSWSKERDGGYLGLQREDRMPASPKEDPALLRSDTGREPVMIPFRSKEPTLSDREEKPPEIHFRRTLEPRRSLLDRRDSSPSPPSSPSEDKPPSPSSDLLPPPPDEPYEPCPPPQHIVEQTLGRGNYLVLYDPQTTKHRKGKERVLRYDGLVDKGKEEIEISDARLRIPEEKRVIGNGPRKNRHDGLVEMPKWVSCSELS